MRRKTLVSKIMREEFDLSMEKLTHPSTDRRICRLVLAEAIREIELSLRDDDVQLGDGVFRRGFGKIIESLGRTAACLNCETSLKTLWRN